MKLAGQIVAGFLLLFWPIVAMTSPMMIGAPGASNRLKNLLTIVAVLSYPLAIGLTFYWLEWDLFLSPKSLLLLTLAAPAIGLFFYGVPILNLMRGIANEGYTVKSHAVYAHGKKIVGADPASFELVGKQGADSEQFDARDKHRRYFHGKPI
jgi:hypothetical protein